MAELQTITAAFAVVKLASGVIDLVKKLVHANSEAQTWLKQIQQMSEINAAIRDLLQARQTRRTDVSPPPLETRMESLIYDSVAACETYLREMAHALQPPKHVPMNSLRYSTVGRVGNLLKTDFIRRQEKVVDYHVRSISMSLNLIHSIDLAATHTLVQSQMSVLAQSARNRQELVSESVAETLLDSEVVSQEGPPTIRTLEEKQIKIELEEDQELPSTPIAQATLLQVAEKSLMVAVKQDQYSEVESLLTTSEDSQSIYCTDIEHWTVLHHAAQIKSPRMLKKLLDAGLGCEIGFINQKTRQGMTALMIAARHSETTEAIQMAKLLLDAGCDPNIANKAGQTALYFVIEGPPHDEEEELADLLVARGANVARVNDLIPEQVQKYQNVEEAFRQANERQAETPSLADGSRLNRARSLIVG